MKDKMSTYFKTLDEDQKNVLKSCAIVLLVTSIVGIASFNFLGAFFALLASRLIIPKFFANRNKATFKDGKIVCEKLNKIFDLKIQKIYVAICVISNIGLFFLSPAILVLIGVEGEKYIDLAILISFLLSFICSNLYLLINKIPPMVMLIETSFLQKTDSKKHWDWYEQHSHCSSWRPNNVFYKGFD